MTLTLFRSFFRQQIQHHLTALSDATGNRGRDFSQDHAMALDMLCTPTLIRRHRHSFAQYSGNGEPDHQFTKVRTQVLSCAAKSAGQSRISVVPTASRWKQPFGKDHSSVSLCTGLPVLATDGCRNAKGQDRITPAPPGVPFF